MKKAKTLALVAVLFIISYLIPYGYSQTHSQTYQLLDNVNGSTYYRLNVTVQESLYDYYVEKSHSLDSNNGFAKFVTPYALKPIADKLSEIYTDDEDFANGVLMIVHQIPYEAIGPVKYPVEVIVENRGDCDLFSYVAASIIKARGLDVVLLYYESQAHMNIGISLSHAPHDTRSQAYYITYNNICYYVAEVTGGDWQNGWRVGECPEELKDASAEVITLENCEQSTYGQVSASYKTLTSSTISLIVSPTYLIQGSAITLSGQLSPALQNKTVTIYIKVSNSPWTALDTVTTNNDGHFTYIWSVEETGICYIRVSWSGDGDYAGTDSTVQTVTILSTFFISLLAITMILVCVGMVVFFMSRPSRLEVQEPQPPGIPDTQ